MAVYNPFTNSTGRLGGVFTLRQPAAPTGYGSQNPYGKSVLSQGGAGNIFGDIAKSATSTPTGEGYALGYSDSEGDTPIYRDNAWKRFVSALSPYLNQSQLAYLNNNRGLYESATADVQAIDPSRRFADVLGNADVVRQIQGASPFSLGASSRYVPTRFR